LAAIRILVVDDHYIVRHTLCGFLNAEPDMEVVCEATGGLQAIRKAEQFQPDVVVLDIGIPELNGLNATPLIKQVAPKSEILVVSQYEDSFFVRRALAAGARGFITKTHVKAELIEAVRQVHAKKRFVGQQAKLESEYSVDDPGLGPIQL
jgi:DNA-binding NarL/FixJ family response regulator